MTTYLAIVLSMSSSSPNVIEEEPVTSGEDDDILSTMATYDGESETDED